MARLDVAGILANVRANIAAIAAWQTLCSVADNTAAAKRVYYGGVQEDYGDDTRAPLCVLQIDPAQTEWNAGTSRGRLTVNATFELAMPAEKEGDYGGQYLWCWQALADIMAGVNSSSGGSGQLMLRQLNITQEPGLINPDENQGRNEWAFQIALVIDLL